MAYRLGESASDFGSDPTPRLKSLTRGGEGILISQPRAIGQLHKLPVVINKVNYLIIPPKV